MPERIGVLVFILGSIDLYGENQTSGCRGKTPGSVRCDATTEGRTVQAAACRAAVYGFDSHPRLHLDVPSELGATLNNRHILHQKKRKLARLTTFQDMMPAVAGARAAS
jgi:hypothetical protein